LIPHTGQLTATLASATNAPGAVSALKAHPILAWGEAPGNRHG